MPSGRTNYGFSPEVVPDTTLTTHGQINGVTQSNGIDGQGTMVNSDNQNDYDHEDLPTTPEGIKREKRRIWKNVCVISLCFLLNFTAYNGLARLQSSLHKDEGMGTVNQAVLYGALVLSCLFIPKLLISAIGHKWTIPLAFVGYILWMAANGYAVWGTMVTGSILTGLCAAPLWTAQCAYFTKIASRFAKLTNETEAAVISRFFGIFFMFFQLSGIFGSVISLTILMPDGDPESDNATLSDDEVRLYCGLNDCPDNDINNPNEAIPDEKTLWTMVGTYIAAGAVAIIIACTAVDNLPKYMQDDKSQAKKEAKEAAINTAMHLRNRAQCLLIPITIYSGFEQAFYSAEWNASFITCGLGIWKVGLVTLPFGAVNAIVSIVGGQLVKYIGRIPIFTLGLCVDLSIQFTMLFWPLDKSKEYVFYIISALWGLTDGIWQTQINALYGSIFADNSEAAFSNYRMWESLGFIVAFGYSSFLCTNHKLYVLMSVLLLGMILYYVVEGLERKKEKEGGDAHDQLTGLPTDQDNIGKSTVPAVYKKTSDFVDSPYDVDSVQDGKPTGNWPEIGETYGYQKGMFTHI